MTTLDPGLYQVTTGYLCAGLIVGTDGRIECAPILRNRLQYWQTIAVRVDIPTHTRKLMTYENDYPNLVALSSEHLAKLESMLQVKHHVIDVTYNSVTDQYEFTCEHPLTERLALPSLMACPINDAIRNEFGDPEDPKTDPIGHWFARIAPPGHELAGQWQFMKPVKS